jgi:ABC-type sugar transport system ATPase subunit
MRISIQNLRLRFRQGVETLYCITFDVQSGEFVGLVGPSCCGKSTALNAMASLISPDEGRSEIMLSVAVVICCLWNQP